MQTQWILGLDIGGSGSRAALQRLDAPASEPPLLVTGPRIEVGAGGIGLPAILASLLPPALHEAVAQVATEMNLGLGKIAQPLRVAVSGTSVSPPIDATLEILGRETTLNRIARALAYVSDRASAG